MTKRILGIDLGDVRTGIAVSDAMQMLASGVGTITAYNDERLLDEIAVHIKYYDPELIVIGYPINMDGSIGPRAEKIGNFLKECNFSGKVKVLQYHDFSGSRYEALGMENTMPKAFTSFEDVEKAVKTIKSFSIDCINGMTED
jgi:putative transcription antitermination factor YqgF